MPNLNFSDHLTPPLKRRFVAPQPVPANELRLRPLMDDAGSRQMAVNATPGSPAIFSAVVPETVDAETGDMYPAAGMLLRIHFWMVAPNGVRWDSGRFGHGTQLPNGVRVALVRPNGHSEPEILLGDLTAFRSNADWLTMSGIYSQEMGAVGEEPQRPTVLTWSWPIHLLGYNILLRSGDAVRVWIRDNLTTRCTDFQGMVTYRTVAV